MADRTLIAALPDHVRGQIDHLLYKVPPDKRYETREAFRQVYALGYHDGYRHGCMDTYSDEHAKREADREAEKAGTDG